MGLRFGSLLRDNSRLVHDMLTVSVIALFVIASAVSVAVMFVVFTIFVVAFLIVTVDVVTMSHFLSPFVRVNTVSSVCWVEDDGYRIWAIDHCV